MGGFLVSVQYSGVVSVRYRTEAANDSATAVAAVPGGIAVMTSSPLRTPTPPDRADPEQLLALAWSTCLNATAQAIVRGERRTRVRVEVDLADAEGRDGFEFHVSAFVSGAGLSAEAAEELAASAHARCPISRLLHGSPTVQVHGELFAD